MSAPVIVTGAAGFIGYHLACRLEGDGPVIGYDSRTRAAVNWWAVDAVCRRSGGYLVRADVTDGGAFRQALTESGARLVYHLAAESHVDASIAVPIEAMRTNALGTMAVAEECARAGVPLVYASTDEVYGDLLGTPWADYGAVEDETPLRPSSPYSAGKAAGEMAVQAACRTSGLRALVTRASNGFGPCQVPEKLLPIACARLARGEPVPLHGGGSQVRQWVAVEEMAEAFAILGGLVPEHGWRAVNIGGPVLASVRDVVLALASEACVAPDRAVVDAPDRPGQDRLYHVFRPTGHSPLSFARRRVTDGAELRALLDAYSGVRDEQPADYRSRT